MRKYLLPLLLLMHLGAFAQEKTAQSPRQVFAAIGQYPASLAVPSFSSLHPGALLGISKSWNHHSRHQLVQSANLAYFYHRDVQHAAQAFTELSYRYKLPRNLAITPLALGGGYVMSILDMKSLRWNSSTERYEVDRFPLRNNWMITLGASLSFESKWMLFPDRKTSFFLDYRLLVQGVFVRQTVPVVAYSPLRIGLSIPLTNSQVDSDK